MTDGNWPKLRAKTYRVPERFNFGAALAMITFFGVTFGALRHYDVHPIWYVYLSLQALLICGLQMTIGGAPRSVSTLTGSFFLPLCYIAFAVTDMMRYPVSQGQMIGAMPTLAVIGAAVGYGTGALAAGIFLTLDRLNDYYAERTDESELRPVRRP